MMLSTLQSRRLLAAGALVAMVAAATPRQADAQDASAGTYLWTFDYKQGDVEKFRTHIKIAGKMADGSGDVALAINSVSRQETKDVSADGTSTYDQIDEQRDAAVNGKAVAVKMDQVKPVTITLGKNGLMLKRVNPADTSRPDKVLVVIQSLPAPDKPVKVGDTWKTEIPNVLLHNKTVVVTQTLAGVEKVLGLDALKIRLQVDIPTSLYPSADDTIKLQETYYLDAKTHHVLREVYSIKNPLLPIPGIGFVAHVVVSRVVPGVNDQQDDEGVKLLTADPQTL
jgi:hypothetical protein